MEKRHYRIGGHLMEVQGDELCTAVEVLQGFAPFAVEANGEEPQLCFAAADRVKTFTKVLYELEHEGVVTRFGHTAEDFAYACNPPMMRPLTSCIARLTGWLTWRATLLHACCALPYG